jgi:hypothetical protein
MKTDSEEYDRDYAIFIDALNSKRGPLQQRIAAVGLQIVATLLRKNADYGSSAWKPPLLCPGLPPRTGILVRMSDKINRFMTLMTKPAEVTDESVDATMLDFGGYSILYLAYPGDDHDKEAERVRPAGPNNDLRPRGRNRHKKRDHRKAGH